MIRVLIVDDEPWALKGIVDSYNWEANGFTVIEATTDPEAAKSIILNKKPDLVFTDICMPETSGLALMRLAKENDVNSKFVIVSGFSEFQYAQEAIRYGVYAYLLKPLDLAEMQALMERYKNSRMEDVKKESVIDIITTLTYREEYAGRFTKYMMDLGFPEKQGKYQTVIVSGVTRDMVKSFTLPPEWKRMLLPLGAGSYAFFVNSPQDIYDYVRLNWQEKCLEAGAFLGIGLPKTSLSDIEISYDEADTAIQNGFFNYKEHLFMFSSRPGDFEPITLADCVPDTKVYISCICKQIEEIKRNRLGLQALARLYNSVMVDISKIYGRSEDKSLFESITAAQLYRRFQNADDFTDYLTKFISYFTAAGNSAYRNESGQFSQLMQYINENYTQTIYLRDLSAKFYLHPNYICDLFKARTGMTFINYITKKRMKKALDLLESTDKSIIEVAELSGYGDYSYFIKVFKRNFMKSPAAYRKERSQPEITAVEAVSSQ